MAVACGGEYTFVIDENGRGFATGLNNCGQLGLGGYESQAIMAQVPGLPAPVRQVAVGACHTAIVTQAGDLLMCGDGTYGRLGLGDENNRATPTLVPRTAFDGEAVLMVACGLRHTVVATEDGKLWTWGAKHHGQLGHGDELKQLAPRQVPAAAFNGERIVMVAAGFFHTVALSEAGHVYTWGYGLYGQLGHGHRSRQLAPLQVEPKRFGEDASDRVVFVAAGGYHTVAVTVGGRLYTWGTDSNGQLGQGDYDERALPTLVAVQTGSAFGGSAVVMAACGDRYTLVVTQDGALWACGRGDYGQLGLNNKDNKNVFELVQAVASGDNRVVVAAAGYAHSAVVTKDGSLWTWGKGMRGQLGYGYLPSPSIPRRVTITPENTIRIGIFHGLPRAHVLAFTMGAHYRLGATSPLRNVSGEEGLLSMIAQFGHTSLSNLPPVVKKSEGLMRLLGVSQRQYQMRMTVPASSEVP